MNKTLRRCGWAALVLVTLAAGSTVVTQDTDAATCYGTLTHYFETSACQVIVGSKVSCQGYPDQIDSDPNGNWWTPYSTSQSIVCPCPSGGGGGSNGGGDPFDSEP